MIKKFQAIAAIASHFTDEELGAVLSADAPEGLSEDALDWAGRTAIMGFLAGVADLHESIFEANPDAVDKVVSGLREFPLGRAVLAAMEVEAEPCSQPN